LNFPPKKKKNNQFETKQAKLFYVTTFHGRMKLELENSKGGGAGLISNLQETLCFFAVVHFIQ